MRVTHEYRLRIFCICACFIASSIIALTAVLIPSYLLLHGRITEARLAIAQYPEDAVGEKQALDKLITDVNKKISLLQDTTSTAPVHDMILPILRAANNVSLEDVSWSATEGKKGMIHIAGIAPNRELLKTYADTLSTIPLFTRVDVPLSSFIKDTNIRFRIDITL